MPAVTAAERNATKLKRFKAKYKADVNSAEAIRGM
jgi:hypothetical protein